MKILEITFELKLTGKSEDLYLSHPNASLGRIKSALKWMCVSPWEKIGMVKVKEKDG